MNVIADQRGAAARHAQRAAGQTAALATMIGGGRPFPDVAQQILAARGSLDSLLVRLIELELESYVTNTRVRHEIDELLRSALGRTGSGRHAAPP